MDCFGTYFTHVQNALIWTWQPAHMEHTKYTAVRPLKTCTWQRAHMEHTKYTAVRTKVYIQQNHSACTDEALGRVYRWGPWLRVQTRPLPLRPWPEPSACTCDPGPEPSACTCDPRKRVHSRPPDHHQLRLAVYPIINKGFMYLDLLLMLQKSGDHQLRLVVYPTIFGGFVLSQVVFFPDFWTIKSAAPIFVGGFHLPTTGPCFHPSLRLVQGPRTLFLQQWKLPLSQQ